jgi:tetratricopeptide (TPR) repeat protein
MTRSSLAYAVLAILLPSPAVAGPFEQGVEALDRQVYDTAISCFDQCLRENPRDVSALGNRGLAWAGKKDYERAIADYSGAISLNAGIAVLFVNRANAYADKREPDRAIADYSQALRLNPKMVPALAGRATAHADKQEFDRAIADYTQAIGLDANDAVLFSNRGTAYINRRLYAKAIADFMQATRLDPKYAPAWNNFAWILATCPNEQLRDGKRALACATRACELSGGKVAGHLCTLAAAHAECGNFAEAIRWEKQAIALGLASKYEKDRSDVRMKCYQAGEPYHDP